MGHEIVTYRNSAAVIQDDEFEAVRHFLLMEAEASSQSNLAAFVRGWSRAGPGVWVGVDFDAFFHADKVLEEQFLRAVAGARLRLHAFGEYVPIEYIEKNLDSGYVEARPVATWLIALTKLEGLFANANKSTNYKPLLAVLREARSLLGRRDNDFAWSSWEGAEAALSELDAVVTALESGKTPDLLDLRVLFAATGPIQEVSLSSGWSQEFLDLAARFDVALQSL
jgi:hypothetical protein